MVKFLKIALFISVILLTNMTYAQKPNIIVIVADDLGNADVGYNGGVQIPTPNIDALASGGVVFSNGYSSASESGPSRAGILTGRYQNRFGFENSPNPTDPQLAGAEPIGIPLSQKTMGRYMKDLGYNTKAIGKWYVGGETDVDRTLLREYSPLGRGFDDFFGFLGGTMDYFPTATSNFMDGEDFITEDLNEYLTDAIAREAVEFIEAKKNDPNPFFIYMAFNAVQGPLEAKQVDLDRFASEPDIDRRTLCAAMYSMDENIGKVLTKLEDEGLTNNTLIIFISDNGGDPGNNYSYNTPYKEGKSLVFEGGTKVPFVMKWPGNIDADIVYGHKIMGIDILPTMIKAAGGTITPADEFDGEDLLPYLNCEVPHEPHELLFWRRYLNKDDIQWAVRDADWKLVYNPGATYGARPMLFNISIDPTETNDLYSQEPIEVARLQALWDEWNADNVIPLWGAGYNVTPEEEVPSFDRIENYQDGTASNPKSVYRWYSLNIESELVINPSQDGINNSSVCVHLNKTNTSRRKPTYSFRSLILDFSSNKILKFKVYRPRDVSSFLDIYISHDNDTYTDIYLKGIPLSDDHSGWVQYEIDLTNELISQGMPDKFNNKITFVFGPGNEETTGGSYYLDDIEFVSPTLSNKRVMLGPIKVIPTVVLDNVRFESSDKIISVRIYDMIGQLKEEFRGNDIKTISMEGLTSGNYILDINTHNGRESVKVIKK